MNLFGSKKNTPQTPGTPHQAPTVAQGIAPKKGPEPKVKKQTQPVGFAALSHLEKGMISLPDLLAPSSIEVDFRYIRVGDKYYRSFFVVGYPRYVSANWLQPLIDLITP